jgi:uncharacterized protein
MRTLEGPPTVGYPCWIDHASPDVEKAAAFYQGILGWTYSVSGPEYGHYHVALVHDRPAAGLGQPMGDGAPPSWTVYFATDDIAAHTARARDLGGTVLAEPMEVPGQGYLSVIADPTGAAFGLWQPIGHQGFGVADTVGAVAWFELSTADVVAADAFYTKLFDLESRDVEGAPPGYRSIGRGDTRVAGLMPVDRSPGIPAHWSMYLQVEDADAATEAIRSGGGSVDHGPDPTPFGRLVGARDPFGVPFSLMQD